MLVQRRDDVVLRVRPGASGTAVFRVSNPGAAPVTFHPAASLPAGWAAVAAEGAAQLAPGAGGIHFVGFAVPRDARAGAYTVRLAAPGQPGDSVRVIVAVRRELTLRTREAPRFVTGGDPYVARFALENRGNGEERITLRVVSSGGLAAALDSARVVLAAGEVLDVPVRVATARGAGGVVGHLVELHARAAGDSTVAARASSRVEVVPRGAGASGRGRLPVEVRLRNGAGGTPLAAVSGAGTLVRGGSSLVEFLARPADAPGSFLGEPDEYRARFVGRGVDLRAGDHVYSLSPLTQPGRYGFGAGGSVEAGPVTAGGFVVRDRRSALPLEERGGAVALGGRRGSVGAQYLSRTGTDAGTLGSARVRISPFRQWSIDAEYGSGAGVLGRGAASSAVVQAITGRASLFARHLHADSSYPAYFAGERVDEAVLQLRPWRSLLLSGSGLRRRDAAPGPFGGGPSRDLLVGSIGWGNALTAEYRSEERIGLDRTESVALRGMYRVGPAWFSPRAELGRSESLVAPLHLPYHRVSAYGGFDFRRQSVSGWVEHSNRRPYATALFDDGGVLLATLNASLHPTRGTRLQATLQGTRSDDSGEWRYATGEVGVWQQLVRGHRVVARARWGVAGPGAGDAPRFLIDYVIPIGVPTPRGGEDGRVAGRIYDAETARGIAGIPVRIGRQVVITSRSGGWSVAGLAPGPHPLEIDRLTSGIDRVPAGPLPSVVEVRGGRSTRLDVGLVRSARVRGSVRVFAFAEGAAGGAAPPLVESGGLRDATIVLTSGTETHRRATDAAGRFELPDLRPGRWTLRVEIAELPPHTRLERDSVDVQLAAGAATEVTLRLLPRFRPVQIIAGGEVRAGAPGLNPAPIAAVAPAPAQPRPAPPAQPRVVAPAPQPPVQPRPAPPLAMQPRAAPLPRPTAPAAPRTGLVRVPRRPGPTLPRVARTPPSQVDELIDGVRSSYLVQPGDRSLTDVAWLVYRDGTLWPKLWMANRHLLRSPDRLPPGVVLRIPRYGPLTATERAVRREYEARRRR